MKQTESSFRRLTGSDREGNAWREFYGEIAVLARRFAPIHAQAAQERGRTQIRNRIAGGVAQSDGDSDRRSHSRSIQGRSGAGRGSDRRADRNFCLGDDMQANRCFLYHLIGNGNGQWRVPQGGMGVLVKELHRVATCAGCGNQTAIQGRRAGKWPDGCPRRNGIRPDLDRQRSALRRCAATSGPFARAAPFRIPLRDPR